MILKFSRIAWIQKNPFRGIFRIRWTLQESLPASPEGRSATECIRTQFRFGNILALEIQIYLNKIPHVHYWGIFIP